MSKRWITYQELADELGVKVPSAKQRARRNGWETRPGNDGRTEVLFDPSDLPPPQPPKKKTEKPTFTEVKVPTESDGFTVVKALRSQVDDLQGQLVAKDQIIADLIMQGTAQATQNAEERRELLDRLERAQQPKGLLSRLFG